MKIYSSISLFSISFCSVKVVMVVHSQFQVSGPNFSKPNQQPNLYRNPQTTLNYIPCSQINLHHSANPTAHFYHTIEQNDDAPFVTFVQEPYCYRGKPQYTPGNGVTFYHSSPDLVNPRATLTISNNLANQFFFQRQFSGRDISTCSIELPTSKLYPLAGSFSCSVLSQPAVKGLNIFTARARYSPRAGDILFDQ